jgi:flagellar FliJ protein
LGRPFKFEAVLSQRQYREESARKVFADASRELNRAKQVLGEMHNNRERYRRALCHKQARGGSASEIILYSRYLGRLDSDIRDQQQQVAMLAEARADRRRELMTALKDRKVIEKLKERHLADQEKEEREMEQKILNDAAISRYQRRH